jgi:hypothetical protein
VLPTSSASFCCVGVSRWRPGLASLEQPGALGRAADIDPDRPAALRRGDRRSTLRGAWAITPGISVNRVLAVTSRLPGGPTDEADWPDGSAKHGLHDLSPGLGPR